MEEKTINIKDKTEEEIYDKYLEIAKEDLVLKEIWDNTKNLTEANKIYQKYESMKEENNNE